MNRPDCPVLEQVRDMHDEIRRTLRRLRRSMRSCKTCLLRDECSLRFEIHEQVRQAAEEVLEELGV